MKSRRASVLTLALFAVHSVWNPAPVESVLPAVAAAPKAPIAAATQDEALLDPSALDFVRARLQRYQNRAGLTDAEIETIANAIVREADRYDLEPELVLAVMHVESRYDPYAVSDKNAMGLMQVLPSTGEWLAPQVGVAWDGPHTLFDPVRNIRLGTAYLRMLSDRYDGRTGPALVAYNWGPGNVDKRLRRGGRLPSEYTELVSLARAKQS